MNTVQQLDIIDQSRSIPKWMPDYLRGLLNGQDYALEIPSAVRSRCRRPVKVKTSDWSVTNRQVTEGAHPGPWRHEFAPHAVKIMDTFDLPWVREVWYCKVEQSAGTNSMLNCLGRSVDCDPGDFFMLMPREKDSDKMAARLKRMFRESNRLKDLVSPRADDMTNDKLALMNGVTGYMAHANSPASMASHPAKYAFGDEVDKYPRMAGREADPITLIRKRGRTFRGKVKRMFTSTCGDGQFIYKNTMNCHQLWRFDVRCPDCGALIRMDAEHLLIPTEATPDNVDQMGVGYECNECNQHWDEDDREQAIKSGRWVCIKGEDNPRPARVGFHHRAWECLDVPLYEIAAAWLKAQTGDTAAKIAWANGYEAVDYEVAKATEDYKDILKLCDDRPRDLVPTDVACLLINVDTQQNGFYYEVAAISYANQNGQVTSWLVSKGFLLTFDDLLTLAGRTWRDVNGKEYRIISGLIDSGGTRRRGAPEKHSRTKEVYQFCKANPLFKPVKGTGRKDTPVKYTTLDRWPGTSKPIPGGLIIATLDVHYYKDELASRLAINPDDPGAFILYSGYTKQQLESPVEGITPENELTDYAKHLCAEYKNELGLWEHDRTAGRNDYHDVATYRMYHIELVSQWGLLVRPEAVKKPKTEKQKKPKQDYRRW